MYKIIFILLSLQCAYSFGAIVKKEMSTTSPWGREITITFNDGKTIIYPSVEGVMRPIDIFFKEGYFVYHYFTENPTASSISLPISSAEYTTILYFYQLRSEKNYTGFTHQQLEAVGNIWKKLEMPNKANVIEE